MVQSGMWSALTEVAQSRVWSCFSVSTGQAEFSLSWVVWQVSMRLEYCRLLHYDILIVCVSLRNENTRDLCDWRLRDLYVTSWGLRSSTTTRSISGRVESHLHPRIFRMKFLLLLVLLCFVQCPLTQGRRYKGRRVQKGRKSTSSRRTFSAKEDECGTRPLVRKLRRHRRIIGGDDAHPGSWPWQVAMLSNGTQYCAGSLIHPSWVVTSAHCFKTNKTCTEPHCWTVVAGKHRINETGKHEQPKRVEKIIWHKHFQKIDVGPPKYDIAVVKLAEPVEYNDYVQPICLLNGKVKLASRHMCYITGWGVTSYNGTQPAILQQASVPLVPREVCNSKRAYNGSIHKQATCAGYKAGKVDSCNFDSGGPLSCEIDGRWYLRGVTSWGYLCALPEMYGVYANMEKLTKWVRKNTKVFALAPARKTKRISSDSKEGFKGKPGR